MSGYFETFSLHNMKSASEKQDPLLRHNSERDIDRYEYFEMAGLPASSKINKQGEVCKLEYGSPDWRRKTLYGGMEDEDDGDHEHDEGVPIMPSKRPREEEEITKKPKTVHHLPFVVPMQPINVLICKVYMSGCRNTWRRISVPTSVYCQDVVDSLVTSFDVKLPSTYIAKYHFSEKYAFKGGPRPEKIQHARLAQIAELDLEAGDGFDIIYESHKLALVVECIRKENGSQRVVQILKGVNDTNSGAMDLNMLMDVDWS